MTALIVAGGLLVGPPAAAQAGFSFWLGVGEASDSGASTFGVEAKQVGAQFALPIVPVALRADAVLLGDGVSLDGLSYSVNVVTRMSLPLVQPYALAGHGSYALDKDTNASGWNAGAGLRAGVTRFGVFAEVRRYFPLKRTVTVFGVTL